MDENQKTDLNTEQPSIPNNEIPSIPLTEEKAIEEIPSISLNEKTTDVEIPSISLEVKNEDEDNKSKKKKGRFKNFIWIGVLLAIVFVIGVFISIIIIPKKEKKTPSVDENKIIQEYGKLLEQKLQESEEELEYNQLIKKVKYDHDVKCIDYEIYEDKTIYLNQCSIDGKSVRYSYGKKYVKEEKKSGALAVYVSKDTHKATLDAPSDLKNYEVYDFDIEEKYSNLELLCDTCDYVIYINNENAGRMMNYKTGERALPDVEYGSILPIKYNNSYDPDYVVVKKKGEESSTGKKNNDDIWLVYDLKKKIKSYSRDFNDFYGKGQSVVRIHFFADAIDDGLLYVREGYNYGVIDYRTGKEVIPFKARSIKKYDQYYVMMENDKVVIMDRLGKHYLEEYNLLAFASDDYIFSYENNHHVCLIDINGQEVFDYGEWEVAELYSNIISKEDRIALQFKVSKTDYRNCTQFEYLPKEKKGFAATLECNSSLPKMEGN